MWEIKTTFSVRCRGGFTLLEVLVALIVTSMFLTLLLPATLSSVRRLGFSVDKNRAMFIAKTQLEIFSARPSVALGSTTGKEGNFSWEVDVGSAADTNLNNAAQISSVLLRTLRIRVTQGSDSSPLIDLSAQRLYAAR